MISNEWKEYSLDEIVDIIGGGTPKTTVEEYWNGEIPWLSVKDFNTDNRIVYETEKTITKLGLQKSSTKLLNKGDLIISARGTVGALAQLGREMAFNQSCYGLRAKNKTTNDFLYYLLKYKIRSIQNNTHGSVFSTITKDTFKILKAIIPINIEQQKAIAKILSDLDEKIEINNKINNNLEKIAQAIFKQWFVDFEFPNENGEPYKSSGGEMIESELGEIPKGWYFVELGEISEIQNGFAFKAPEYVDNGIKVMRTLNINDNGYFTNDNIVYLPESYNDDKYKKYILEEFDIALVMVGASIGKIGMVLRNTANSLQNQNMWRFRTKSSNIPQLFLNYKVREAQNISQNWGTGSAREFYRKDSFSKIKILVGDDVILEKFNNIIKPIFEKISILQSENEKLILIRDTLLPKLMSGEIRVPLD